MGTENLKGRWNTLLNYGPAGIKAPLKRTKKVIKESARNKEAGKELDKYFAELVPSQGNAGTVNGEIVRAANKIGYRWYNDGDKFYKGYGTETAGPPMAFLMDCEEIDDQHRTRLL